MDNATATKIRVYAKLNLALEITGAVQGYHLLDMINCTVGEFDELTVKPCREISVAMGGKLCGEENTAYRAAKAIFDATGKALKIEIAKGIPMSAGMGGSSADAAAVLRYAMDCGMVAPSDAFKMAAQIGSDVEYMMVGGLRRATKRGGETTPLGEWDADIVVVKDADGASTAQVYREYDNEPEHGAGIDAVLAGAPRYNVLQGAAIRLSPKIAELIDKMNDCFGGAVMTGSGSAVCAVIERGKEREAARILQDVFGFCSYAKLLHTTKDGVVYV